VIARTLVNGGLDVVAIEPERSSSIAFLQLTQGIVH
jgi:hypothetical protein